MAGIYIHVPYCKTRCIYCDFFTQTNLSSTANYVSALCTEMLLREKYLGGEKISTIYLGGGTPSLLSTHDLTTIFCHIYKIFEVDKDAEITLEANPDDLTLKFLTDIKNTPINRLSIGIQSFDDGELTFLNRRHSAHDAIKAVGRAKDIGFNNISIDLMYGLPNQTIKTWKDNLQQAIDLDISHLSSYHLIYEEKTKLMNLLNQGEIGEIEEEQSLKMFSIMIDTLTRAGFEHYEISNFAKSNLYSKHNTSYWLGSKYLGLGPAAHSYNGINRTLNIASISQYVDGIETLELNLETEILDINTQYNEFVLTGLRTKWGINLPSLKEKFGAKYFDYFLKNVEKYILSGDVKRTDNSLRLTRSGIFLSDGIMSSLMYV